MATAGLTGTSPARALTDIALVRGFTNIAHFSRVFHAYTGLSPREFRHSFARVIA